eukprot:g6860.t1
MSKSRRKTSTLERKRLIRLAEKYLEPCLVRLAEVGTLALKTRWTSTSGTGHIKTDLARSFDDQDWIEAKEAGEERRTSPCAESLDALFGVIDVLLRRHLTGQAELWRVEPLTARLDCLTRQMRNFRPRTGS